MTERERLELQRTLDELHAVMERSGERFWHWSQPAHATTARDFAGMVWVRSSRAVRTLQTLLDQEHSTEEQT